MPRWALWHSREAAPPHADFELRQGYSAGVAPTPVNTLRPGCVWRTDARDTIA